MTDTAAPIGTFRADNGHIAAVAPATRLADALAGDWFTIEKGPFTGDIVRVGTGYRDDADHGWGHYRIAKTIEHPVHGTVHAVYIDDTREGLANAPQLRAALARVQQSALHAEAARIDAERQVIADADRA